MAIGQQTTKSSTQTRKVNIAMVPSPEARMPENKLPVNGYGWCGGVFRPAPAPAETPAGRCAEPSRRQRWARRAAAVALATTPFTGLLLSLPAAGAAATARAAAGPGPAADLVLRHGAIYTVDAARSWAE